MIATERFGEIDGQRVDRFRLTSDAGMDVDVLSYGVTVGDWRVPAGEGQRSIVLGFDTLEAYRRQTGFVGAIQGRVANRIAGARFTLDGVTHRLEANEGPNLLHGGAGGLGRQVWTGEVDSAANAVRFTLISPDGDMGFPGEVAFSATYRLSGDTLHLDLAGVPDRPTPINLCQHHYFNLGTGPDIRGHVLVLDADRHTETGADGIPSGRILPVEGLRFDFRNGRELGGTDYDTNFALRPGRDPAAPAAVLTGPDGLQLSLVTDQPGLQLYTGQHLPVPHAGLCLEDQGFPDAPNHPDFPSIIHTPDRAYAHVCAITVK